MKFGAQKLRLTRMKCMQNYILLLILIFLDFQTLSFLLVDVFRICMTGIQSLCLVFHPRKLLDDFIIYFSLLRLA